MRLILLLPLIWLAINVILILQIISLFFKAKEMHDEYKRDINK
jgi:hypothetical protein